MSDTMLKIVQHDYNPGRGGYCTVCGQSREAHGLVPDALLAATAPTSVREQQTQPLIAMISIDRIDAHPRNIRQDLGDLRDLTASIASDGILQPLLVHRKRPGLQLVDGHRRWAAARLAGLTKVPAYIVEQLADDEVISKAVATGVTNRSLHRDELRAALRTLMHEFGYTADKLADRFGMSKRKVYTRGKPVMTHEAREAAELLAEHAHKAIAAGLTPRDVTREWGTVKELPNPINVGVLTFARDDDGVIRITRPAADPDSPPIEVTSFYLIPDEIAKLAAWLSWTVEAIEGGDRR